jgi:hypothetical protein
VTKVRERKRKRLLSAALDRLLGKKKEPAPVSENKALPKGSNFEKPLSQHAIRSQPHRAPGDKFLDPRRIAYKITKAGELQAQNKPRSREKRRREEAAAAKVKKE